VTPIGTNPATALSDAAKIGTKMLTGGQLLNTLRDADVQIATTPKDLVWNQDKVSLYHFRPLAEKRVNVPVLICYGLIGRWTMTDLQEDRSLVRNLLNLGLDLYVVDWGNPSRADRYQTLGDYILGYLDGCVAEIAKRAGVPKVNLLGVCEGGVFTTAFAALEPERVNTLTLTITPIDFHADTVEDRLGHGFINIWTRSISSDDVDRLIDANGNLPGEFMGAIFNQMSPMRSLLKYNLDLLEIADDEQRLMNWLRMEKWIADRPDHPGEAAKQWMKDLYQQNKLVRNEWVLDGRLVDLGNIRMPVLNVYAKDDHIIPPATSRALGPKVGTSDYAELALPGGHIGVFVGGRSQALFAPAVFSFIEGHDRRSGHATASAGRKM
jgi:polyhydroxyalkanoate synthase